MIHTRGTTLLLLLFSGTATLQAQQDSSGVLQPVEVSATRIASPLPQVGRHLQVVDSLLLHSAARPELSEVLRTATLVDIRQRGPFDAQTDLSLRGGSFDQALVLLDGMPLSDPQTGHHAMDLPVASDALERVEVLYGGASRTFGPGAFSGAVNFVTRTPSDHRGSFTVDGGQYGSFRARVMQDLLIGRTGLRVAAFHARSDGYVPNSDLQHSGGQFDLHHRTGRIHWRAQAAYAHKDFGAQNFYSSIYPDQHEITGTGWASLGASFTGEQWSWNIRAYHRGHSDRFELFREGPDHYRFSNGYFIRNTADTARFGPSSFYTFHNMHRTWSSGAQLDVKRHWIAGTSALGVHARREAIQSNVLGELMDRPVPARSARDPYTRSGERLNLSLHADHRWSKGRWTLDGGLLLNFNSDFATEWSPGIDVVHRWSPGHSTYASAGRAFRFPTWTDLYYQRGGAVGSRDLAPEHADQVELGHRLRHKSLDLKLALWRRQGRDLIDWVLLPGSSVVQAANLTAVNLNGIELEAGLRCGKARGGALYAYQWSDQGGFPFISLYVMDHLAHNAVLWWHQPLPQHFALQVNVNWRQRVGSYARFSDGALLPYPDPIRCDLRGEWSHGPITLFVSVYNLLDAEQMDRANIPLPGRWISGGARITWQAKRNGATDKPGA